MNLKQLLLVSRDEIFKPGYLFKYGDKLKSVMYPEKTLVVVGVGFEQLWVAEKMYSKEQLQNKDVDHSHTFPVKHLYWFKDVWGPF